MLVYKGKQAMLVEPLRGLLGSLSQAFRMFREE